MLLCSFIAREVLMDGMFETLLNSSLRPAACPAGTSSTGRLQRRLRRSVMTIRTGYRLLCLKLLNVTKPSFERVYFIFTVLINTAVLQAHWSGSPALKMHPVV